MSKTKCAKPKGPGPKPIPNEPTKANADNDVQFELELYWCVQQLENALNSGKLNQKMAEDTTKNLKTLKSNSAPIIKKRQVMNAALGNYRSKMKDEEKQLALAPKQITFTPSANVKIKSGLVKKSTTARSGGISQSKSEESGFKFNFVIDDPCNDINLSGLSIK